MNKKRFLASFLSATMICSPLQGSNASSAKSGSNQGMSSAAKMAIAIGGGVAGLAVLVGAPLLWWGLSKDNSNNSDNNNPGGNFVSDNGGKVAATPGNTKTNSDPADKRKTNVTPVTPRKTATVGKIPIGNAQADYEEKNHERDTFFEGYGLYNSKNPGQGTRVSRFLHRHCRYNNLTDKPENVDNGFLVVNKGQGWVASKDTNPCDVCDRIFIQAGNTKEENISYRTLHSILWSEKIGQNGLTKFLRDHHDLIKEDFLKELFDKGYVDAVNKAFPGRFQSQSDRSSGPQGTPTDASTGEHGGSTGTGVVPGPHEVTHGPVAPEAYYDDRTDSLTLDDIDPVKNPGTRSFMSKEQLAGGYNSKFRYMTLSDGRCATNMTGYGHGIAHVFAYVTDEINRRVLIDNLGLRTRNVRIYKGEIPGSSVSLTSSSVKGSFEYNEGPNVVGQLEALKRKGCKRLAVIDPANAHHPGGAPGGALTLEETICGQSTLHTIIASSLFKPYYEKYNAGQYDPFNLAVAKNVCFYSGRDLIKGYMRRQGMNPTYLTMPSLKLNNSSVIFADVFVTAAPDKSQSGGSVATEDTFKKWVKQQALAAKELDVDGIVVTKVGVGAFKSFKPEWFAPGGLFETTWREYAPDIHVIILDTPETYNATLNDAQKYLHSLDQAVDFELKQPNVDTTSLTKVKEMILQAEKDVVRDADPLKKAASNMVFAKSAEEGNLISSGVRNANTLDVLLDKTVCVGNINVDFSAIADHVQPGKEKGGNVAACYYGGGAIESFIEDAANAYKPLTWRNSNNYIWHQYSRKNPKSNGYRFSEPTKNLELAGILKRFVEINGCMCEATYDANNGWVMVKTSNGNEYYRVAENQVQKWFATDTQGNGIWRNVSFDPSDRTWK